MKKEELPPANMSWGNSDEVIVQIQHPSGGGGPVRITVDKKLTSVRFEDESEERVTIVIEAR